MHPAGSKHIYQLLVNLQTILNFKIFVIQQEQNAGFFQRIYGVLFWKSCFVRVKSFNYLTETGISLTPENLGEICFLLSTFCELFFCS